MDVTEFTAAMMTAPSEIYLRINIVWSVIRTYIHTHMHIHIAVRTYTNSCFIPTPLHGRQEVSITFSRNLFILLRAQFSPNDM